MILSRDWHKYKKHFTTLMNLLFYALVMRYDKLAD